jgi:hypothetical protein
LLGIQIVPVFSVANIPAERSAISKANLLCARKCKSLDLFDRPRRRAHNLSRYQSIPRLKEEISV